MVTSILVRLPRVNSISKAKGSKVDCTKAPTKTDQYYGQRKSEMHFDIDCRVHKL